MANTLRSDPLRNFKFQVNFYYITQAHHVILARLGFMSVSGLAMSTEMIPYREGGMNTTTKKMPGQSDFPPVTFQRGLFQGQRGLFEWFRDIFSIDRVAGKPNVDFRTTCTIRVLPHPSVHYPDYLVNTGGGADPVTQKTGRGKQLFSLVNAWPTSLSWSDLDAGGNGIIMEQMTVVHEGLIPTYASSTQGDSFAKQGFWA